jgi:hypothetical protein
VNKKPVFQRFSDNTKDIRKSSLWKEKEITD